MKNNKSFHDYGERLQNSIKGLRAQAQQVERQNANQAIKILEHAYQVGFQSKMNIDIYAPVVQRLAILYRRVGKHIQEINLLKNVTDANPQYDGTQKWLDRLDKKIASGHTSNEYDYIRTKKLK